jgi:hypothetical protein
MKRVALISLLVVVIVLTMAGIAQAATPQDIYNDWAADGKLDGHYTDDELRAYLNDATIHQYGITNDLDIIVRKLLTREEFPFTGFEMLLAGVAVVVLVGGGVALRLKSSR